MQLDEASAIATEFCDKIKDVCVRIAVAGSIRRERPVVNDIDLLVIPKYGSDMFGLETRDSLLDARIMNMQRSGELRITADGDKVKRVLYGPAGVPVDIYVSDNLTWATLLLVRTGSKEHNIMLCQRANELGMHLRADGSGLWRGNQLVARAREELILAELCLPYVEPQQREVP